MSRGLDRKYFFVYQNPIQFGFETYTERLLVTFSFKRVDANIRAHSLICQTRPTETWMVLMRQLETTNGITSSLSSVEKDNSRRFGSIRSDYFLQIGKRFSKSFRLDPWDKDQLGYCKNRYVFHDEKVSRMGVAVIWNIDVPNDWTVNARKRENSPFLSKYRDEQLVKICFEFVG